MSELKLMLVNYQNHSKSCFSFKEGINCIVGPSSSGKTAVFRALETALYNLPRSGHVKQGTKLCRVGISYNNHTALYQRDLTASSQVRYQLDGQELKKVGRNPVIDAPLGFQEVEINGNKYHLNFVRQMAYPFLLDQTPSTMYQVVIQSKTSDSLNKVNLNIKGDIQSLKVELTECNAVLNVYKDNATAQLSKVNKAKDSVSKLDRLIGFSSAITRLQMIRDNCNSLNEIVIPEIPVDIPESPVVDSSLFELYDFLKEVKEVAIPSEPIRVTEAPDIDLSSNAILEQLINEYLSIKVSEEPREIHSMENPNFYEELPFYINQYKLISDDKNSLDEEFKKVISELNCVDEELSEFKVCPYCGNQLHERNDCNDN